METWSCGCEEQATNQLYRRQSRYCSDVVGKALSSSEHQRMVCVCRGWGGVLCKHTYTYSTHKYRRTAGRPDDKVRCIHLKLFRQRMCRQRHIHAQTLPNTTCTITYTTHTPTKQIDRPASNVHTNLVMNTVTCSQKLTRIHQLTIYRLKDPARYIHIDPRGSIYTRTQKWTDMLTAKDFLADSLPKILLHPRPHPGSGSSLACCRQGQLREFKCFPRSHRDRQQN